MHCQTKEWQPYINIYIEVCHVQHMFTELWKTLPKPYTILVPHKKEKLCIRSTSTMGKTMM